MADPLRLLHERYRHDQLITHSLLQFLREVHFRGEGASDDLPVRSLGAGGRVDAAARVGARGAGRFSQEPDETGAVADGGFAAPGAEISPLRVMVSRAGLPAPPGGPRSAKPARDALRRPQPDPDSYGKNIKKANVDTHMLLKFSYRGSVLSTVLRRNWAVACLPGYEWRFGGIAATWPSRAGSGMSARRAVAGVFAARRMAGGGASGLRRKGETP